MESRSIAVQEQIEECRSIIESLLFVSDVPLSLKELNRCMDDVNEGLIRRCIDDLNERYDQGSHSFRIRRVANGFQLASRKEYAQWIRRLYRGRIPARLTQAALECLAIVAYKQPISRTEVEAIRGVSVDGVLRNLLDRDLIRIAGRGDLAARRSAQSVVLRDHGRNRFCGVYLGCV